MRTRRGEQLSPLRFDPDIERTAHKNRAHRRLDTMSFSNASSSIVSVAQEPSGEATGMSFIPQFQNSTLGARVLLVVQLQPCTYTFMHSAVDSTISTFIPTSIHKPIYICHVLGSADP